MSLFFLFFGWQESVQVGSTVQWVTVTHQFDIRTSGTTGDSQVFFFLNLIDDDIQMDG